MIVMVGIYVLLLLTAVILAERSLRKVTESIGGTKKGVVIEIVTPDTGELIDLIICEDVVEYAKIHGMAMKGGLGMLVYLKPNVKWRKK